MKRIRVVHITPSVRLLGARRSLLALVKDLAGTRVESLVVVPSKGALTDEFDKLAIPYRIVYLPPWRKGKSWLTMARQVGQLRSVLEEWNADLIHCNEIYPNPHALVAASGGGIYPELLSRFVQGSNLKPATVPVVTHMRLSVNPRLIKNYYLEDASRLIAVSQGAASDFDAYPWKSSRVRVVYNGLDSNAFASALAQRSEIRKQLGFEDDHFVIGQFGLMMPRKRPDFLLYSVKEILKTHPNARFLFIGDTSRDHGQYLEGLKNYVIAEKLEDYVKFLPFQQNIAPYFAALDLNMLVSNEEGFGRVILEAGAMGVPTVGSRVGGIPELIQHEKTGYLLGNPEIDSTDDAKFAELRGEFVERVHQLISDKSLRSRMAANLKTWVEDKFSVEQYTQGAVAVFDEALAEFDKMRDKW